MRVFQNVSLYFIALAALGAFVAICMVFQPAFAEPASEKPVPISHTRTIVESMHVVSMMGNAGNAPVAYVRALSDSVSVTSTFQQPGSQNSANSSAYRSPTPSTAGSQRAEEKNTGQPSHQRTNQNLDTRNLRSMSATPIIVSGPPDVDLIGDNGEDPPDDLLELNYQLATERSVVAGNAYFAMSYGAMGIAVIVLYVRNSGAIGFVSTRSPALVVLGSHTSFRHSTLGGGARTIVLTGAVVAAGVLASGIGDPVEASADSPAGIAYRIGTSGDLGYREWDPSTSSWSLEASLTSAGSQIEYVKFLYSPTAGSELRVIAVRETNGEIDIYYCTAGCTSAANWNGPNLVVDMGSPTGGRKYFDMAFEHTSGDLLIVYDKTTTTDTNDFFYQIFDSDNLTLSGESGFDHIEDTTTDNDIRFFQMVSKPGSDEIAMALLDATNNDLVAFIWDGSSFGNQLMVTDTLLSASTTGESFAVAYESSSGAALVVGPGLASSELRYARYNGSWSSVSTLAGGINPDITADDSKWMTLKADPNPSSNKIMACATDDASDFSCVQFDAGTPGTPLRHESATGGSASRRGDYAWVGWNSTGLALWYDNGSSEYQYSRWNSPTSIWSTETAASAAQTFIWVTAVTDRDSTTNGVDSLWAIYSQASPDNIGDGEYDSATFTLNGLNTISASAGTANVDDVVSLDSRNPRSYSRSPSDTLSVSDNAAPKITGRGIPDSVLPSDSISTVYNNFEPTSDSLALADSIATSLFSPGNAFLFESVVIADSISTTTTRSLSDSIAVTDSTSKRANKLVTDTIVLADDPGTVFIATIAETLAIADSATRTLSAMRSTSDTLTFADDIPPNTNPAGMAYRSNTGSGTSFPKYREWNPDTSSWSAEVEIGDAGSPVRFAWIEFSPVSSKRVIVTLSDDGFLDSFVCDDSCTNASSWDVQNNVAQVRASLSGVERPFDMEYEQTSGDLVLVYDKVSADSSQDLFYRVMPDASNVFGSESSINDTTSADTDVAYPFMRMDSRRTAGSDALGLIALDATNSDAVAWVWDGDSWGDEHELTGALSVTNAELIDVTYESSSGNLMVAAGEGTDVRYNRFTTSWQTSSTSTGTWAVGNVNWLRLVSNPEPSSNEIFLAASGSASDFDSAYWSGSSWTDHAEHDDAMGSTAGRGFDFAWTGDSSSGVLIWRTTAGQLDYKRFSAPDSFSTQGFFIEDANHNWVQLATNPETGDQVAVLGATIDTNNDIGGIRWDGSAYNPASTGDNAITTVSLDTYEAVQVDFQKATRVSKSASETLAVSDSLAPSQILSRSISDSFGIADDPRAHIPTPFAESVSIGDTISKAVSKSMSDSLAFGDSLTVQGGGLNSVSVSDSVAVSDSVSRTYTAPRSTEETLAVTDSVLLNVVRPVSESLSTSDSAEVASAASSSNAGSAYRSSTGTNGLLSPKYREWDPATETWSVEVELPSTGSDVRDAKLLFSPSSSLRVIVSLSADGSLNLFKCDASCTTASSWTHVNEASFANVGTLDTGNPYRPFDIAFEQSTGTLLIVYDKELTENADFYYRTFDGTTLSAESSYSYAGSASDAEEVRYFKMASKSNSDEIAMMIQDATNANSYALIWDGSSFGNQLTVSTSIGSPGLDGESIGAAYETASGSAVVFSASGTNVVAYARWSSGSWSSVSTTDPNVPAGGNNMKFVRLAANPSVDSNEIMVCQADDVSDLSCAEIDAGVLGSWTIHDTGITTVGQRTFDFAWNPSGSGGLLVWGTAGGSTSYSVYDGSDWGVEQTVSSAGGKRWIVGASSPSAADVVDSLFLVLNSNLDIGSFKSKFNTLELIDIASHTSDTSVNTFEAMSIDFQKSSNINIFISDELQLTDAASKSVFKSVEETLAASDSVDTAFLPATGDSLDLDDSVSKSVSKGTSVSLGIGDSVTAARDVSSAASDTLAVEDAISAIPVFAIGDSLTIADSVTGEPLKGMEDQLELQDDIATAVVKVLSDSLASSDDVQRSVGYPRSASDSVTIADAIEGRKVIVISDSLAVSDVVNVPRAVSISDSIGLDDDLDLLVSTLRLFDGVEVTDAVGITINVSISDSLTVADLLEGGRSIAISDSVGVGASLTDVSWERTLALDEGLALASDTCTPEECQLNLHLDESLGLQDEWVPPPSIEDSVAIADSVAASFASAVQSSDSVAVAAAVETSLEAAPPDIPDTWDLTEMPRAMAVTDPAMIEPPEAPKLPGTYDISGGVESLLEQTDMPVYDVSQMISATDMTGKTFVFPAFQASITSTPDMPGRNTIMTPIMDSLPAGTAIYFPVDVSATLSEETTEHPASWMAIDYTPGASATNFALALSMLDERPASAQDVQAEVSAFFIDIDWAGTFAGPDDPSDPDFYTERPDLTFAITDDWASQQRLERDENGVPVLEIFLLNDDTGEWEEILDIDSPTTDEDGLYTYVVHLEHFSTYVVTSSVAPSGGVNRSFHVPVSFAALISDSIAVTDAQEGRVIEVIEEFTGGKRVNVGISDLLGVLVKPIAFSETFEAGRDVTVSIALDGVRSASIVPPEARATLIIAVENSGDQATGFTLNTRYVDQSGRVPYESSEVVEIGPHTSLQKVLEVPFVSAGDFVINLDARDDGGRILGAAQIEVTVPWLAVNMHFIIAAVASILAGVGTTIAYILRRPKASEDVQAL